MKQKKYDRAQQEFLKAKKVVDTIAAGLDHTLRKSYLRTKEIKDLFGSIRKLRTTGGRKTRR